jgi:hypothetical protein
VLDFTFCDIGETLDILRAKPVSGQFRQACSVERPPKEDSKTGNFSPTEEASRKLIKAKNKKGEEEAYEFAEKETKVIKGEKDVKDDVLSRLAEQLHCKYECEALRLCRNELSDVSDLTVVLRSLVANSFLTISWLDLNSNNISVVPDLSVLPLTTLHLHNNSISDLSEVDKLAKLPYLSAITLFGNPIATKSTDYKNDVLTKLLGSSARRVPLRSLDFAVLSLQDLNVGTMYECFKKHVPIFNSSVAKYVSRYASPRQSGTPRASRKEKPVASTVMTAIPHQASATQQSIIGKSASPRGR